MKRSLYNRCALSFILFTIFIWGVAAGQRIIDKATFYAGLRQTAVVSPSADSVFDPEISWPTRCGCQQTGRINAVFDGCGEFGAGLCQPSEYGWPSASFQVPAYGSVDYLWGGAIWIGGIVGEDTLVSSGIGGAYTGRCEFNPPGGVGTPSVIKFDYSTDFSMRAVFTDTITKGVPPDYSGAPYEPLGLRIANRSHVRRYDPYRDVILYDVVVTNIGDNDIRHAFLGMYWDSDIYRSGNATQGFTDDLSGSLRSSGIVYSVDNDGDPVQGIYTDDQSTSRVFAFAYLGTSFVATDTNFSWWASSFSPIFDFGPRRQDTLQAPFRWFDSTSTSTGTPLGNANQYYIMSFPEWDYDQCQTASILPMDTEWIYPENRSLAYDLSRGSDTRFLMSIGPFDLPPDSSIRVQYATFTADSIHTNPDILSYLPNYPSAYTATLGLERLPGVADAARQFADDLLDPLLPPIGLEIRYSCSDSIVFEWDPWVFDDVTGYTLHIGSTSPLALPHPGVIPPWPLDVPLDSSIDVGPSYRDVLSGFNPDMIYVVELSHRTMGGDGQLSPQVSVHPAESPAPPTLLEYSFAPEGEPLVLRWRRPVETDIDHYNIYKFGDSAKALGRYLPFYDTRSSVNGALPRETITREGHTYFYYALDLYGSVGGEDSTFVDWAADGNTYVVTSVDPYGFESEMSAVTIAYVVPQRNRDVLVLTHSSGSSPVIASISAIQAFYDSVFAGTGLDYEIYDLRFDCVSLRSCPDWRMLQAFRWVIIDDIVYDAIPFRDYETDVKGFTRYILSGGGLTYFGGAFSSWSYWGLRSPPMIVDAHAGPFIDRFFGVDSLFVVGASYNFPNKAPDSLFGFNRAEPVGSELPGLRCNTEAYPLGPGWEQVWPLESPPAVLTYRTDDRATVTHGYRSLHPVTSLFEGGPVGVKTATEASDTYLFGFHLYYMRVLDARGLIGSLLTGNRPPELRFTEEPNYEVDGLFPDTGHSGTIFTFRVQYSDPDGDPAMAGYPRVYVIGAEGPAAGSPFVMHRDTGGIYVVDVAGLIPGEYIYRIEARDGGSALAGGEASDEMSGPLVRGNVRHVAVTGSDETGTGGKEAPYGTIQHAVETSTAGDAIIVHEGVYSGAGNRDIDFGGRALILRSEHGASVTVIDCGGSESEQHRGFQFQGNEDIMMVIDGFTVTGGYADSGGSTLIVGGSPAFRNCVLAGNGAHVGPAVVILGGSPLFENCTIVNNKADGGGAIEIGAVTAGSPFAFRKCIVAFNRGVSAVGCDTDTVAVTMARCDVFGNERGDWAGCISIYEGNDGNVSADPFFCDTSGGDYSLQAGSPCLPPENESDLLIGALNLGCVPTSVDDGSDGEGTPYSFELGQNYPNPFNSETVIRFSIPKTARVTITVYNVLGQKVAVPMDEVRSAGEHKVFWDGSGPGGNTVASGIYFYQLQAGAVVQTKKMLLVK